MPGLAVYLLPGLALPDTGPLTRDRANAYFFAHIGHQGG